MSHARRRARHCPVGVLRITCGRELLPESDFASDADQPSRLSVQLTALDRRVECRIDPYLFRSDSRRALALRLH